MENANTISFMGVLEQIGHTPCPSCNVDRVMTAASSPDFRSQASLPTKSSGLIDAERKIKHYKTLLRIATDKLEEAIRRANEAAARATSAEMSAVSALIKVSTAEATQHRSEIERLQVMQDLERQRGLTEEMEMRIENCRHDKTGKREPVFWISSEVLLRGKRRGGTRGVGMVTRRGSVRGTTRDLNGGGRKGCGRAEQKGSGKSVREHWQHLIDFWRSRWTKQRTWRVRFLPHSREADWDSSETKGHENGRRRCTRSGSMQTRLPYLAIILIMSNPRRKNPKSLPRLPASAFIPPNASLSDSFPLAPVVHSKHPARIVDANVIINDDDISLTRWFREAGPNLTERIAGVVLTLSGTEQDKIKELLASRKDTTPIISLAIPFKLQDPAPSVTPKFPDPSTPISFSTVFYESNAESVTALKWALQVGRPVDINLPDASSEGILEGIQDLLAKATADLTQIPSIIIANYLPPPHDLGLPIVRLMNHPHYQTYQAHIAALSLIGSLCIKYVPPAWNALPPPTPLPGTTAASSEADDSQQRDEWKRRIRMYLGPVIEAFGYERIIFGSSPSPGSHHPSHVGDWYEIAREALAELGVEQEYVDAIFYGNAKRVYGA